MIAKDFFNVSPANPAPVAAGDLLVAQPFLAEQWFNRGVISVIDHDPGGTTGVVLNLPVSGATLSSVLDGIERPDPVPVYCGGPLSQDRLYFVHTLGDSVIPGARAYGRGMWIGGDFDAAVAYVNAGYPTEGLLRFIVGYSGWSGGQLDEELEADTWAVLSPPADPAVALTGSGDRYWHDAVRRLGSPYRRWDLLPQDTKAN